MIEMRRNHVRDISGSCKSLTDLASPRAQNLRVSTLEQWKQRVIEFRSRTIEVSAEYDRKMLK